MFSKVFLCIIKSVINNWVSVLLHLNPLTCVQLLGHVALILD